LEVESPLSVCSAPFFRDRFYRSGDNHVRVVGSAEGDGRAAEDPREGEDGDPRLEGLAMCFLPKGDHFAGLKSRQPARRGRSMRSMSLRGHGDIAEAPAGGGADLEFVEQDEAEEAHERDGHEPAEAPGEDEDADDDELHADDDAEEEVEVDRRSRARGARSTVGSDLGLR
jgi:hypothetical protein